MEKRKLGQLEVGAVGLGCMGFSHAYGAPTEKNEAIQKIRESYEMGYTFFDTAECYLGTNADGSTSYNEELVGEALKEVRNHVVIATKCGVMHSPQGLLTDSRPDTIRKSVEGSLKKLGVDTIDLYYQHRIDPKVSPEEVAGTMSELIKEGKIRFWGISETDEMYLKRANAVCQVSAIQNRYSMMAREYENLFPVLEELDIGFVAFSPMGNGFLSGKYSKESKFDSKTDFRSFMPQYTEKGMEQSQPILDLLHKLSEEKGATPAQISLAWMLCKKPYIVPIPGSRKTERLKENIGSADIVLTNSEIKEIDEVLDQMSMPVYSGKKS